MSKKAYNEGIKTGLEISHKIIERDTKALEYLRDEVGKLPAGFEDIKTLIRSLSEDMNDSELAKLYGIIHIYSVDDMEQDDKTMLMCIISTATKLYYPNEEQQKYSRALRKHLNVASNDCKPIDESILVNLSENIDSIKAQKAMYLVLKEYFYLADNSNEYGDKYDNIFKCFINGVSGIWADELIKIKIAVFGYDGLIEQYGSGELDETDFYSDEEAKLVDIHRVFETDDSSDEQTKEAIKSLIELAGKNYAPAQLLLANCYRDGLGVEQNYTKAARHYKESAGQGNDEAQFELGKLYANGNGIEQDWVKAIEYYSQSAKQGNYRACCNLGICYYNGDGTTKDTDKAIEYLKKSAENKNSKIAPYSLGIIYFETGKDSNEAVAWLNIAVNRGYAVAALLLATHYLSGELLPKNEEKAYYYLSITGNAGCVESYCLLGECLLNGTGVTKDEIKAVEYYEKAANVGDPIGLFWYGYCLINGIGIEKNIKKGKEYQHNAEKAGYKISSRYRIASALCDFSTKFEDLSWKGFV